MKATTKRGAHGECRRIGDWTMRVRSDGRRQINRPGAKTRVFARVFSTPWGLHHIWRHVAAQRQECDPPTSAIVQALLPHDARQYCGVWLHRTFNTYGPLKFLCESPMRPGDDAGIGDWLIFADWLEAQGGEERAEAIRIAISLDAAIRDGADRPN